ncbi:MAG: BON domain-containing protein [Bryobacterales bacterium]|nr:BON domain-containing protein [Bryobacterales bacterium]
MLKQYLYLLAALVLGTVAGCSTASTKSADVANSIRSSLDQAGLTDVMVSQDRDKGVVTLRGNVADDKDKAHAGALAQSFAGSQVVSNQIAVVRPGSVLDDKRVNSDLDEGIESNLNAALIRNELHDSVKYSVKNHVVTLTGEVDTQAKRDRASEIASLVPNVQQVVNQLQVRNQKASTIM